MVSIAVDRVRRVTPHATNERIRQKTRQDIERVAARGPTAIMHRLRELDREWDIERCLEVMAPTFTLVGLTLGLLKDKRWFVVPAVIQSFFLQHALQGWCPPIPLLRELGIRTQQEIDEEKYALKAIRGDFRHVKGQGSTGQALAAAKM
jgi:hypothetical protein